jgi:hypothetical protein
LGVACLCHDEPFHFSASVSVIPEAFRKEPTATHDVADAQDMARIWPPGSVTFGECWMLQSGLAASAIPAGIAVVTETIARTTIAFAAIALHTLRHIAPPPVPSARDFDMSGRRAKRLGANNSAKEHVYTR